MSTEPKKATEQFVPVTPAVSTPPSVATSSAPATKSTSTMAVLGLVFAFFLPLLGFIFSIIGLGQTKPGKQGGRGLAIAGLILSSIFMVASLIFGIILIVAAVTADNNVDNSYTSLSSSLTVEPKIKTGVVGSVVSLENFDLTVQSAKKAYVPVDSYYTPEDGNEYVLVTVNLKNTGSTSESYSDYDFMLRNSSGVETNTSYMSDVPSALGYGSLAGGGTVTGSMVFEAKKGDTLTLIYKPSYFANEAAEIKL